MDFDVKRVAEFNLELAIEEMRDEPKNREQLDSYYESCKDALEDFYNSLTVNFDETP